ncbi:MAG TPA: heme ABC transporter ATP-binding protein [Kiritimatiellia bacterium]|nr:heme ABC transporter ATP-binding protein [Kiritimatiellia bacterium]
MISLEHATVERGGRALVREVDLELQPGALTVILGANGAGKTSLVRLLSGEWMPTRGRVLWDGKPLEAEDRLALARRRAVVSQHPGHDFPFRAIELVLLGRLPHARHPDAADHAVAQEAMEQAGIASHATRRVDTLSGGERQRVHLARALAQLHEARRARNGVLLLDEPTAHLDLAHQERALTLARRLAREGLAVAAVLHDVNLATAYADQAVLMKAGRIMAAGRADCVLNRNLLCAALDVDLLEVAGPDGRPVFVPAASSDGGVA